MRPLRPRRTYRCVVITALLTTPAMRSRRPWRTYRCVVIAGLLTVAMEMYLLVTSGGWVLDVVSSPKVVSLLSFLIGSQEDDVQDFPDPRVLDPPIDVLAALEKAERTFAYNDAAIDDFRQQLDEYLNTREQFVFTKKNAPLHTVFNWSAQAEQFEITPRVYNAMPLNFRLSTQSFKTCSIVGNSGILANSGCGREIDQAGQVFRFNMPPMSSLTAVDIGQKTHFVTCNYNTIRYRFNFLHNQSMVEAFRVHVRDYTPQSTILAFPFNRRTSVNKTIRFYEILKRAKIRNEKLMSHPNHRRGVMEFWRRRGLQENSPTSGFYILSSAFTFCKYIKVYGFWPFQTDRRGNPLPYHFDSTGLPPDGGFNNTWHRMDREFFTMVELYRAGVIKLVTGKC